MGKIIVGVALGVFVGAMVGEILKKTNPNFLLKIRDKIKKSARAAKNAFMEGYVGPETI